MMNIVNEGRTSNCWVIALVLQLEFLGEDDNDDDNMKIHICCCYATCTIKTTVNSRFIDPILIGLYSKETFVLWSVNKTHGALCG